MNPGLVVKLRPSGPWRIGPDTGARNRVDVIYHSDSLYSAIASAMSRLGWLEDWLDATARTGSPAVSVSSCFPYLDDLVFVVPPRTVWPPAPNSTKAARVRWKSARFVPLPVVQSILAGKRLDENQWSVDGASDCLVPAGKPGPFRTAVRSNAGVDRLTGASERHSTACIEFRAGSGLWTVVSFADESAQERWSAKVKAAFRLLADTGFGGERSRGWGRSDAPEFIDGMLPDLILPVPTEIAAAEVIAPTPVAALEASTVGRALARLDAEAASSEAAPETPAVEITPAAQFEPPAAVGADPELPAAVASVTPPEAAAETELPAATAPVTPPEAAAETELPSAVVSVTPSEAAAQPELPAAVVSVTPSEAPAAEPELPAAVAPVTPPEAAAEPEPQAALEAAAIEPAPTVAATSPTHPHWLLSLFTPAPADSVDWRRGNYTVLPRGGRVDSPAGSGELKKQIQMVAEGSVLYAETAPRGSAADVAPDGFAHPVFRAGFAVAIPLPEVR